MPRRGKVAFALTGASLGLLGGAGAAGCVAIGEYDPSASTPEEARADIDLANEELAVSNRNLDEIRISIGEVCFTALNPYTSKEALAGTPENTVVADLLADPKHPCGTTPSEVRVNYRQYADAESEVNQAITYIEEGQADLEYAEENAKNALELSDLLTPATLCAMAGAVIALAFRWAAKPREESTQAL